MPGNFKDLKEHYHTMSMKALNQHLRRLRSYRLEALSREAISILKGKISLIRTVIREKIENGS